MTNNEKLDLNSLEKVSGGLVPPLPKEVADKIMEERKKSGGAVGGW